MSQQTPPRLTMAEAKRRFILLMKIMLGASGTVLVAAFSWLYATGTPMPPAFIGAIVVAVVGSLMLAAALMGLIFFSAASGADSDSHRPDQ